MTAAAGQSGGHRVVVVGGGFAGVRCALGLKDVDVDVTLVDRRNFHLFQPLLYQVATGGLSPGDIAAPLRGVLKDAKNTRVVLAEVTDLDTDARQIVLDDGHRIPWDTLVLATGATHSYFGKDEWRHVAPGLKTIEDAVEIRARVLEAFERAELTEDPAERQALLTFVVVGGGPTGVELAGALGELSRETMAGEFRSIDPTHARIVLIEASPHILSMYVDKLARYGVEALTKLGVQVRTSCRVIGLDERGVDVETPAGKERIEARVVLWGAGVAGSPLGRALKNRGVAELDRAGRVVVESDCTLKARPDIFVLGDLASFTHEGKPLPGVAPVAMQMGDHTARAIHSRLRGRPIKPFSYLDKGTMAVIGRNRAVARVGFGLDWNMTGFLAWLAWLFIHILYLVDYENRLLVVIQWANHYVTRNRGARLIAGTATTAQEAHAAATSSSAPPHAPPKLAPPAGDGARPPATAAATQNVRVGSV